MNWFYEENGKQSGPVSEAQLLDGRITPETLVWKAGQAGWMPARSLWPHMGHSGPPPLLASMSTVGAPASLNDLYAPPSYVTGDLPSLPTTALWQMNGNLVCPIFTELPHCCVKCGGSDAPVQKVRKLYWHHPGWYFLILVNLLVFIIVAMCIQNKAQVLVSLCTLHAKRLVRNLWIGWLAFFSSIGLFVLAANQRANASGIGFLAGVMLLLFSLIWLSVTSRLLVAKRIGKRLALIKGVTPQILEPLPIWDAPID